MKKRSLQTLLLSGAFFVFLIFCDFPDPVLEYTENRPGWFIRACTLLINYSLPYKVTSFFRYSYLSFASASFFANNSAALSGFFIAKEA